MQKKIISALYAIFFGLFFCSCSDFILPKRVEIKGGVDLPVRMGMADINTMFMEVLQTAFSGDVETDESSKPEVLNVVYDGQTVQTFCIHFPIEMTENLNPNVFLETINTQINDGISSDPLRIEISLPPTGLIPIDDIPLPFINPIYLDGIARYVIDIDFSVCNGTVESGIGINFHLDEVVDGLEMVIECPELNFSSERQRLKKGNNIFGNSEEKVNLKLDEGYENGTKQLKFNMQLYLADPNENMLDMSAIAGSMPGEPDMVTLMKGEVRFFQNWTEANIDMKKAIKATEMEKGFSGTFPNVTGNDGGGFNLSGLGDFLQGGFTFDGLETKMYMNNPVSFEMGIELKPHYEGQKSEGSLYSGDFSVGKEPFVLSAYLEDGNYTSEHLPGVNGEYNDSSVDDDIIADIFDKMPGKLVFEYIIDFEEPQLTVKPEMFNNSSEHSIINISLMIMLPLRLVASTNGSVISFPDMFGESNDLFGRDEADKDGNMFELVKINKIKMTINFLNPIFSGGHLFIDGDKNTDPLLFYPDGIRLSEKSMVMDFSSSQMEIIQGNLIKPNFWIKLDEGDTATVPKNMGIMGVKFEINSIINIGELFE